MKRSRISFDGESRVSGNEERVRRRLNEEAAVRVFHLSTATNATISVDYVAIFVTEEVERLNDFSGREREIGRSGEDELSFDLFHFCWVGLEVSLIEFTS